MRRNDRFSKLITRTMGSKSALLRAMQRSNTPVTLKTIYNWCEDSRTIKVAQLVNLSKAMNIPICELIQSITIKHEGDE